jgi:hypothetical protein
MGPDPNTLPLLPRDMWSFARYGERMVAAGIRDHQGTVFWQKFDIADIPNELFGLEDLDGCQVFPAVEPRPK